MRLGLPSLILLSAFLLPAAVHAETINFNIVSGADDFHFFFDPAVTTATGFPPDMYSPGGVNFDTEAYETYESSPGVFDTADLGSPVTFFFGGGIAFSEVFFSSPDFFGTSIPLNTPIEVDLFNDPTSPYTLTVTDSAATPEPSSLALLGTGALGAFGMVRRRYNR